MRPCPGLRAYPFRISRLARSRHIIATTQPGSLDPRRGSGDEAAWGAIVDRFAGLVWSTARAHRLAQAEAADVAQTTWLRLVENLDRIKEPERLGAWLATTARRECLRHIRLRGRELATVEDGLFEAPSEEPPTGASSPANAMPRCGGRSRRLSERCQALLRLLAAPDRPATRRSERRSGCQSARSARPASRCLEKLRRTPELAGFGSDRRTMTTIQTPTTA